jgi:hypothetical protein
MRFWDLFDSGRPSVRVSRGGGENAEQPTAAEYVEWLLKHMLRTSCTELTIDTTRTLPGAAEPPGTDSPPCIPNPQAVINRLKLLSGLNPIRYAQPVAAGFEKQRAHHTLVIATRFHDGSDRAACTIKLSVRGTGSDGRS